MHTLLEQIRAQIGNVKEYVNKGHHHRAIVTELEKVEKRFSEYEEVASLASLAPAAESEGDRVCHDDDGCPTENAVLRREWRKLTAQVAALTAQCEADKRDAELWRAGVKHAEFPEFCSHDNTQPSGSCWYTPMYSKPLVTADEAYERHFMQGRREMASAPSAMGAGIIGEGV
jgi:hypothetical protein